MWVLVCVDVEATGRSPYADRITQLGAVAAALGDAGGAALSEFSAYVYTPRPLSARVRAFNGITRAMIRDADAAPAVLARFEAWLAALLAEHAADGCVLAAHNGARLDFPMLFHHYALLARRPPFALPAARLPADRFLLLDTLPMLRALSHQVARLRAAPSFALDALHAHLLGAPHAAHDALADSHALLAVLRAALAQPGLGPALALIAPLADPLPAALQTWERRVAADQATEDDEARARRLHADAAERAALDRHAARHADGERRTPEWRRGRAGKPASASARKATATSTAKGGVADLRRAHSLPASPVSASPSPVAPPPCAALASAPRRAGRSLTAAFEALAVADRAGGGDECGDEGERDDNESGGGAVGGASESDEDEWDVGSASDSEP